jgi:hypothetical protein
MEHVVYFVDEDEPANTGWWIIQIDEEGYQYDSVGPYESEEEAKEVAAKYPLE